MTKYLTTNFNDINFDFINENVEDFGRIYGIFINYCFDYLLSKKTDIFFKKKIFISLNKINYTGNIKNENISKNDEIIIHFI